jgi:hypothetical protein
MRHHRPLAIAAAGAIAAVALTAGLAPGPVRTPEVGSAAQPARLVASTTWDTGTVSVIGTSPYAPTTNGAIRVSWQAPTTGNAEVTGWVVRTSAPALTAGGWGHSCRTHSATTTTCTVTGLTLGRSYVVNIAPVDGGGLVGTGTAVVGVAIPVTFLAAGIAPLHVAATREQRTSPLINSVSTPAVPRSQYEIVFATPIATTTIACAPPGWTTCSRVQALRPPAAPPVTCATWWTKVEQHVAATTGNAVAAWTPDCIGVGRPTPISTSS